jgi:hypothetical protein
MPITPKIATDNFRSRHHFLMRNDIRAVPDAAQLSACRGCAMAAGRVHVPYGHRCSRTTNSWIVKTWNPDKETTGSKADWPMAHRIEQLEIGPREMPTAK